MADETIGSVRVGITADYSGLLKDFQGAQQAADRAGEGIAASFSAAANSADQLTAAKQRLKEATAAAASEAAKMLAQVKATSPGYQQAQAALGQLNAELQAAQVNYNAAAAAATGNATATSEQGAAAATAAAGNAELSTQVDATVSASGRAAGGFGHLFLVLMAVRRGIEALEKFRESEEELRAFSVITGESAQSLAGLKDALALAGADGEKTSSMLMHLAKSQEEADQGSAKMADNLRRLGVTSKEPIQAFLQISDAIHGTRDRMEALAVAEEVLGTITPQLAGAMAEGSDAIRKNEAASKDLSAAQGAAVPSAHELTTVQQELKAAFEQVATNGLPLLTVALKAIGTVFADVSALVIKPAAETILLAFRSIIDGGRGVGNVLEDLGTGAFWRMKSDANSALADIQKDFKTFTTAMVANTKESSDFIDKLWSKPPASAPEAGTKPFPKAAPKANTHEASDQMQIWRDQLEQLKTSWSVTLEQEENFWNEAAAIAERGAHLAGAAGLKWANVVREAQAQAQAARNKEIEEQKRADAEELKILEAKIKQAELLAEQSGGGTAQVRAGLLQQAATAPATGEQGYSYFEGIQAKIPDAQRAADRESLAELKTFLSEYETSWKETIERTGKVITPAAQIAMLEKLKRTYSGVKEVVDALNKAEVGPQRQQNEQNYRVSDVNLKATADAAEAANAQQKLAVQRAYDALVAHTYQSQIDNADKLAAIATSDLTIKLNLAEADLATARAMGAQLEIARALLEVQKAQEALALQKASAAAAHSAAEQKGTLQYQIGQGLYADMERAGQSLAQSFGNAVASGKGIGQVFDRALKSLESSAISTVFGAAIKKGIEESGIGAIFNKIFGAVTQTPQIAATTANTTAMGANTAAVIANTTALSASSATGGVGAAGGIGSSAASAASDAASSASMATALAPIIGGAIGGVISGIFTLIGDAKIVRAVDRTTAAVNALRASGGLNQNSSTSTASGSSNGALAPTSISSALDSIMGGASGFLGFNSFTTNGVPVDIVRISTFATLGGGALGWLAGLIGFAGGGRPSPGVPAIIGEKGPELWIPDAPGTIVPNHQLSRVTGSSSLTNNYNSGMNGTNNFHIYGMNNPLRVMKQISDTMKLKSPQFGPLNQG